MIHDHNIPLSSAKKSDCEDYAGVRHSAPIEAKAEFNTVRNDYGDASGSKKNAATSFRVCRVTIDPGIRRWFRAGFAILS